MAHTILLVDDNYINVIVAQKLLEKHGFHVITASNGAEAVDTYRQNDCDLILTDIAMPVMDGIEAAKAIRALSNPGKAAVPIIGYTAFISDEIEQQCREAGMNTVVAKPFTADLLTTVLQDFLSNDS